MSLSMHIDNRNKDIIILGEGLCILLITIALLIVVSIYCYLVKYWTKQKHLLPFHDINKELIEVLY